MSRHLVREGCVGVKTADRLLGGCKRHGIEEDIGLLLGRDAGRTVWAPAVMHRCISDLDDHEGAQCLCHVLPPSWLCTRPPPAVIACWLTGRPARCSARLINSRVIESPVRISVRK